VAQDIAGSLLRIWENIGEPLLALDFVPPIVVARYDIFADGGTIELPKLRSRYVVLDKDGLAFFRSWANGKSPTDRLFTAAAGKPWRRDMWAEEVRSAIAAHNKSAQRETRVPTEASAYSFRHARISDLLQVYGVDPLTVAAQTGTSLRLIERTYFKFIRSAMLEKLASLKAKPAAA
jgi:integrase